MAKVQKRKCVGARGCKTRKRRGMGELLWDAPTTAATLYVGTKRGMQPHNRAGACSTLRGPLVKVEAVDREFYARRKEQVGAKNVGATRSVNKGYYEGAPERSVSMQVIFVPNEREPTPEVFRQNMAKIADAMARKFCQDSVILSWDSEGKKHAYGYGKA